MRRASYPHTERVDHLLKAYDERDPQCPFKLMYADLTDVSSVRNAIEECQPDEVEPGHQARGPGAAFGRSEFGDPGRRSS